MNEKGIFIGVSKHVDPDILDLPCASRDATALWALFSDTFPEMDAKLLTDESASTNEIKKILESVLLGASEEDSIILSFSGHGTYDHALVPHDASLSNLDTTTITTEHLAMLFRDSKAKSILLILDCCFSGSTPARVIGMPSQARSVTSPFRALVGKGRAIITASSEQEPAWESSVLGHGFLTKGLIDVMESLEEITPLGEVMKSVTNRVIDSASQIHKTQTPVHLIFSEGGFSINPLRAGVIYQKYFPDLHKVKISTGVGELSQFGLPEKIISLWKERFSSGLNQLQVEAINDGGILVGESLAVVAPTSSGKTFVGELAAVRASVLGKKSVFLVPYKALANEQVESFSSSYTDAGLRIIKCTGDSTDQLGALLGGKFDIAVLTYEMFLGAISRNPWLLEIVGLVVLDEAHFIGDHNRGIVVELILTILRTAKTNGIAPQLVLLSAVVKNFAGFDEWLGIKVLMHTKRPVPLREGTIDRNGTYKFLDEDGTAGEIALIASHEIVQRKKDPSSQDLLVPLVRKLVQDGDKVLIFRNQKGATQGCAMYLAAELGLSSVADAIGQLPIHDLTGSSGDLRTSLSGGVAFHNASLSPEERRVVEKHFRDSKSALRVLVATSTVAAGVNLPAEDVIVVEHEFKGQPTTPYTVAQYKNMAGRAGRMGLTTSGRSFLYAESGYEADQLFTTYVSGELEPLSSSFVPDELNTWVLRLLSQVDSIERNQVATLLANTFGGFQEARKNPDWLREMTQKTEELLERMERLHLIDRSGDFISLSLLGRVCATSTLSFESCLVLVELIEQVGGLSSVALLVLIQLLPEFDDFYTPVVKKGTTDRVWTADCASVWNLAPSILQRRIGSDQNRYLARCKRVCVLWDWINGDSLINIENKYDKPFANVDAGWIRSCAEQARYRLRSVADIAMTAKPEIALLADEIDKLLIRLEHGLPEHILPLAQSGLGLTRGECLALLRADVLSVEDLTKLTPEERLNLLGKEKADFVVMRLTEIQKE